MLNTKVHGSMLLCFAHACKNHQITLGHELEKFASPDVLGSWFDLSDYKNLCNKVSTIYTNPTPVLEKIGEEMMKIWFQAAGKNLIKSGVDFIKLQTSSDGYKQVVQGPSDEIGYFSLKSIDEKKGIATVESKTPLNREVERGVLRGGINLFNEYSYISVNSGETQDIMNIEFH